MDVLTNTPKPEKEKFRTRRRLFKDVPLQYVSTSVPADSFTKPDYEIHSVKCRQSLFLAAGESLNILTNVIITEAVGRVVGFLAVLGNPQCYWLESMTTNCFCIKTGVLPGDFVGNLKVSESISRPINTFITKIGQVTKYNEFVS
jgi:hypothetical protein